MKDAAADLDTTDAAPLRVQPWKVLASVWIVFHLLAVFIAPTCIPPFSQLEFETRQVCQFYLQALYLDHGYRFFAPEPGPSTLLGYAIERKDGTRVTGRIPHRDIHPRLLYHRHFMLTEFFGFLREEDLERQHRAYARHLCLEHDAQRVHLTRITHLLPAIEYVRDDGVTLNNPESYQEQPLGTYERDEF